MRYFRSGRPSSRVREAQVGSPRPSGLVSLAKRALGGHTRAPGKPRRRLHNLQEEVEVPGLGAGVWSDPPDALGTKPQQITNSGGPILGLRVPLTPPRDQVPAQTEERGGVLEHNLKWSHSSGQTDVECSLAGRPSLDSGIHDLDVLEPAHFGGACDERALATRALDERESGRREGNGQGQTGKARPRPHVDDPVRRSQGLEVEHYERVRQMVVPDRLRLADRCGGQRVRGQEVVQTVQSTVTARREDEAPRQLLSAGQRCSPASRRASRPRSRSMNAEYVWHIASRR